MVNVYFVFCFFVFFFDLISVFFFFQAEDGIRDHCVTGVQTCALPDLWGTGSERGDHRLALSFLQGGQNRF